MEVSRFQNWELASGFFPAPAPHLSAAPWDLSPWNRQFIYPPIVQMEREKGADSTEASPHSQGARSSRSRVLPICAICAICGSNRRFRAHNPPNRLWRRAYSSSASYNCAFRKSGHNTGVTTNSA